MRILFTGASSFTGTWFVRELVKAGHEVTCTFQRDLSSYTDVRAVRVERLKENITPVANCAFGDETFLKAIQSGQWDLFCHHAADVTNYRSPDFDVANAVANNTRNLHQVLLFLVEHGCQNVLLTGSVFEQGEGAGSDPMGAFSPYGLSKGLTAEVFQYYCREVGVTLGKFVIPNPFGPFEEHRFTSSVAKSWLTREPVQVKTPAYVRDNIHISLLAKAYRAFAEKVSQGTGYLHHSPSGYPESQGAFALRFATAMRERLNLPCQVELLDQTDFPEPQVRINTEPLDAHALEWNESEAWDELADYYRAAFQTVAAS